jgi:hypothetical protein
MKQIIAEYTGNGNQRANMSMMYSIGAANMYTVGADMLGVGQVNSPNVPTSGVLSISDFKGASQKGATAISYPPSAMTSYTTVIGGKTYVAGASSERDANLSPWMAFDNTVNSNAYEGWQTTDNRYTSGAALTNPSFDGFTPADYSGEWISFALPFPLYLKDYTIQGDATEWRLYGSLTPGIPTSWSVLHTGTRVSPAFAQTNNYALNLTVPYAKFVMKIKTTMSTAGFGRASMSYIAFNGFPA